MCVCVAEDQVSWIWREVNNQGQLPGVGGLEHDLGLGQVRARMPGEPCKLKGRSHRPLVASGLGSVRGSVGWGRSSWNQ